MGVFEVEEMTAEAVAVEAEEMVEGVGCKRRSSRHWFV